MNFKDFKQISVWFVSACPQQNDLIKLKKGSTENDRKFLKTWFLSKIQK